jgi:S-formylglutathione hydrolase FrmB
VAAGVTLAISVLLGTGSTAGADQSGEGQLVTITIPDGNGEIPAKWLSYAGPPRADVLLPAGYDPQTAYPLLLLLPGFGNTYAVGDAGELDVQHVLAGLKAIVVMPEGGTGWYTDWWNQGAYGTPEWESYILDEVIPQVLDRYDILPQRRYHAVFGVSMGGLGAAYLGGRLPGFFGSIGILSGFVDLQIAPLVVTPSMDELSGAPLGSVDGPEYGFYTTGHNPAALVDNLRSTRVFMSAGNGVPTAADGTGGGVGNAEEAGVIRPMSDAYARALRAAGVDLVYHTHAGCHCWADFQAELRDAVSWGPFNGVAGTPGTWVNRTVATYGQLWDVGYRFSRPPDAVVRFRRAGATLWVSAAGTDVTVTTSGGCVLRSSTPAVLQIPSTPCG